MPYDDWSSGAIIYAYVGGNPLKYVDRTGLNPAAGAVLGAEIGTAVFPGVGTIVGAGLGILGGYLIADKLTNVLLASKPGSKPKNCPAGTIPIDQAKGPRGWDKEELHGIKDGVGAGPPDWVGITPDGRVITGDSNGNAVDNGPAKDYLH
ncbi:glycine zipper domain-containing protein [Roseateles sp.]|uniref:glycine zipper domain-containing protein n=1 Tax=Roseateles sp. TaxID=1971397 RepID=UPI003BAAF69C